MYLWGSGKRGKEETEERGKEEKGKRRIGERRNGEKKNRGKEEKRHIRKGRLVPTCLVGLEPPDPMPKWSPCATVIQTLAQ